MKVAGPAAYPRTMDVLSYLRDPKAPMRLRRLAYELAEGADALRAEDEAEEACLREWAGSDAAEIPSKTAYAGA